MRAPSSINASPMSDPIRFNCNCGKSLKADVKLTGKKAKCPRCGLVMRVPPPLQTATDVSFAAGDDIPVGVPIVDPIASRPAANRPSKPRKVQPVQNPNENWDDGDDFYLEPLSAGTCPGCGATMSPHAVVCLACGYNKQSGKGGAHGAFPPLRNRRSVDPNLNTTKVVIGGAVAAIVLSVLAFLAQPIAFLAAGAGIILVLIGSGMFLTGAFFNLSQNPQARHLLLTNLLINLVTLPFGWVVVRRYRRAPASPKSRRTSNRGWVFFGIGLFLTFFGLFACIMHTGNRRAEAIRNAPTHFPQRAPFER